MNGPAQQAYRPVAPRCKDVSPLGFLTEDKDDMQDVKDVKDVKEVHLGRRWKSIKARKQRCFITLVLGIVVFTSIGRKIGIPENLGPIRSICMDTGIKFPCVK